MVKLTVSRRAVLGALPATAALGGRACAEAQRLTFLAIGDWGREGASHQREVGAQMGAAAAALASQFTVTLGDNFYEDGVASADDPQWRTSFEDVYTAPSLQTPWYAALGNHDYGGAPEAQIEYGARGGRWRMPGRYYKLAGENHGAAYVDLFFLDTSPLVNSYRADVARAIGRNVATQDPARQLAWLDAELERSTAAWKIVLGHHTIYSGGSGHGDTPEMLATVKPILERRGVAAYINGHDHDMQHIRVNGVNYICSGAGSEVRPVARIDGTRFCLSRSGFAALSFARDEARLEFRDYQGASVYGAGFARG